MSLCSDTHEAHWDSQPLTSRGITPGRTTDHVRQLAGAAHA
ncbi:MAG: hypothetical protein M0Z98_14680 [Actinomycetales bacterium]|nr:hypothetical protein [Actinomycetales bacterium]